MDQVAHLWLFFAIVLGVVLLPGLDMAFVLASSLVGGRRSGLAATSGIVAGGLVHVAMGVLGIFAVLRWLPAAFNALLLAGAAYIAWIGLSMWRTQAGSALSAHCATQRTRASTFRHGLLTSLLNPKAYVFMLAVFPQFLRPGHGRTWAQALVLWLVIATTQSVVYGGMAVAGEGMRGWLASRPGVDALLARAVGAMLLATALLTAVQGWRAVS